jgi:hypothetical protein
MVKLDNASVVCGRVVAVDRLTNGSTFTFHKQQFTGRMLIFEIIRYMALELKNQYFRVSFFPFLKPHKILALSILLVPYKNVRSVVHVLKVFC